MGVPDAAHGRHGARPGQLRAAHRAARQPAAGGALVQVCMHIVSFSEMRDVAHTYFHKLLAVEQALLASAAT